MTSAIRAVAFAAAIASASPAWAEVVLFLTNGRSIVVDRYWEEGDQILYQKNGSTFGIPRHLVERVDRRTSLTDEEEPEPETGFHNAIGNEEVEEARASVKDGDVERAEKLYRRAIRKAPDALYARIELAELYFQRGDLRAAQYELEQIKRIDPDNQKVRERLGDVLYRRGRTALAIREWQNVLNVEPSPGLLYKLKQALRENDQDINFDEVDRAHYVIRYDGQVNETIGRLVATALDSEYYALQRELRFAPSAPVQVTLYTNQEFRDITLAPAWASALNDGEIRIPVEGVTAMTPKLRRVIRHELTHSFITALTRGNCPSWFHEGLAQMREGSERMDPYPRLREAKATARLLPLWSLEGLFVNYSKEKALLVYAEALAATEYIEARRGQGSVVKILRLLAQNKTMNEALKSVVGLDYQEFQMAWEADLDRFRPSAQD